jgi:hypothetical protein
MKKLLLALLVSAPVMATTFASDYKSASLDKKQALILAQVVKMNGYRCDEINAANRSPWSNGKFTLYCNNWNYSYVIEDKGGRIVVTVE